ncbi:hypothetical protein MITS9509_02670 [Synechococcus sp. MIT S9509]|uniref:DUF3086 domain-containing protein n=1 Tax=unclassified Synechococcus TaxID=2626047 RepID=UPI0007BBFE0E|nr:MULTISPECIES: DUF3086 domain-containing protein [unclassified Synechococcus]KZR85487.1 hypothetical protein MITS9504_02023 [Synechococcus sp. MIT S9504]KZR90382.1 hypothetical protein MITS9509_02670 [Synechococcus sp. MIT S9509]
MPDDNDLPLQDAPQAKVTHSEASIAASDDVEPSSESLIQLALMDLQSRRDRLQQEIDTLQQRKQQLEQEMSASFAGQSDAIARRVKGFQEYLGGALQGLAQSVETLELVAQPVVVKPSPLDAQAAEAAAEQAMANADSAPALADTFRPDEELIRDNLRRFMEQPDFYAEPWKLRRSLDDSDITLLEDWFFNQGGRGAQASRGSRPRNVLLAAALIAVIGELYGDQFQTLVLAGQPERLGDWRRGLQDALGLGREDFGPSSGIVLFERGDALVERADRLEERGEVPLILIDAAERVVDIPVLQFPLWLAFAAGPGETYDDEDDLL